MNRYIAPWPVTSIASAAVCAALLDEAYSKTSRLANEQSLSQLKHELSQLDVTTYPSRANFLLLRLSDEIDVEQMIVAHRIVLRSCANFEGLTGNHLRVAVRSESDNLRLVFALRQVLRD